jgi:hypothetical protein
LRVSPASTCNVAAVAVRKVDTFTGSPEASRASTRRSKSCSSAEILPLRFELPLEAAEKFDVAEKLDPEVGVNPVGDINSEGGGGFNPRIKPIESAGASALEESSSEN